MSKKVKADELAPDIAAGYTDRPMTPEEARREFPVTARRPEQGVSHMHGRMLPGTRTPAPTMVLEETDVLIEEPNTGRVFRDVKQVVTQEMKQAILSGNMCLKCKEPHPDYAFPELCDVCGYEMAKRQILDAPMEFDGEVHVGPAQPLTEFMAELEERQEKAKFEKKINEGGSRRRRRGNH